MMMIPTIDTDPGRHNRISLKALTKTTKRLDSQIKKMPGWRFTRPIAFVLELIVLFGPNAAMLAIGIPLWLSLLPSRLSSQVGYDAFFFDALVIGGTAGFAALFRVVYVLAYSRENERASWLTIAGAAAGMLVALGLFVSSIWGFKVDGGEFLFGLLPLIGSAHVLYLARTYIFGITTNCASDGIDLRCKD